MMVNTGIKLILVMSFRLRIRKRKDKNLSDFILMPCNSIVSPNENIMQYYRVLVKISVTLC